jgi:hypothetical protein
MNKESLDRLDKVLHDALPARLGQLKTGDFTKALSGIYA